MEKKFNIISNWLIALSAFVFLLFYLVLAFYNRLASDDILYISILKDKSLMQYVHWFYETWSGRWASYFYFYIIVTLTSSFENIHYGVFLYYCISLFILVYSINTIISVSIKRIFAVTIDTKTSLLYGVLFIASFYFLTSNHIEVWWWICASTHALQGIVFLLLGVALLLKEKKNIFHYIVIAFSFAYVGGSYEVYAFFTLLLFVIGLIYSFFKKKDLLLLKNNIYLKGIIVAFVFLFVSSFVAFTAPGNQSRLGAVIQEHKSDLSISISSGFFDFDKTVFMQKKYLVGIGLSSLFVLLGFNLKNKKNSANKQAIKKIITGMSFVLLLSFLVILIFQHFFLHDSIIPSRGWAYSSIVFSFLLSFVFLCFGYFINTSLFIQLFFKVIVPCVIFCILSFNLYRQYSYVSNYTSEYDKLVTTLIEEQKRGNSEAVFVRELPNSGMLVPMDITDSSITVPIKDILNLKYNIVIKK